MHLFQLSPICFYLTLLEKHFSSLTLYPYVVSASTRLLQASLEFFHLNDKYRNLI